MKLVCILPLLCGLICASAGQNVEMRKDFSPGLTTALGGQTLESWLLKAPPLPPPTGKMIRVGTVEELSAAVEKVGPGGTILLADGFYLLPRAILLQNKKGITLRGASGDPAKVILGGKGWDVPAKGADLLHIGACDGVTIAELTFTNSRSYGIVVESEKAPRDIRIYNCRFRDIGVRALKGSAGRDPNRRAVKGLVRYCNTIWRPEHNWNRGIRIGTGTAHTEILNNLVHGEIRLEGGEAQIRANLTGRLDGYFLDPASGNLALTPAATRAFKQGTPLPDVTEDIRRWPRSNPPDLGAWEFAGQTVK